MSTSKPTGKIVLAYLSFFFIWGSTYVNPVVAIFLGWLLIGEEIDGRTIIATVVILSGVAIVQTSNVHATMINQ